MAIEQPGFAIGFMEAAADLKTKQFYCVKPTADKVFNLCTAAGESFLGVLQDKPDINEVGNIMRDGVTKVMVGVGGLTAGQNWMTAADGTAIAATAGKVSAGTVLIGALQGKLATVTLGKQDGGAGALATNGVISTAAGKKIAAGSHVTTAGEAAANTLSIAHGMTTVTAVNIMVRDAGNNVVTSDADVTVVGANIVVADGATYNTVENQVIDWFVFGT